LLIEGQIGRNLSLMDAGAGERFGSRHRVFEKIMPHTRYFDSACVGLRMRNNRATQRFIGNATELERGGGRRIRNGRLRLGESDLCQSYTFAIVSSLLR
jgi:hypothetical protein